ncbi:MAG TPA: RNase adapter RapZ [Cyclobacteriaceae bacterium]|nr:RNase adapter RapZ [Cyclobacteriaceae bacterium]
MTVLSRTHILQDIFQKTFNLKAENILSLPRSGSYREYYRIFSGNFTAIGVYNLDRKENIAFLEFTRHFLSKGLNVPGIYSEDLDKNVYLLHDLGDTTLFSFLMEQNDLGGFTNSARNIYMRIMEELPYFQIRGHEGLDYSYSYPRAMFDKQSMMWDLNYFKYYFLKLAKIPFEEQSLEDDYQKFTDHLLSEDHDFFMYRDFQSSNIMIRNNTLFYIDYQGGRKGALQYDLASLIFDAKADIPDDFKEKLLDHYISSLKSWHTFDETKFRNFYYGYALIRLLQAMGAFGFRGFYEKKPQFLRSIPFAVKTLDYLLKNYIKANNYPYLTGVLRSMVDSPELKQFIGARESRNKLIIEINSFSYKRGIPVDLSENGGGFVFDCRAIHNPGRYEEYRELNGNDPVVVEFFRNRSKADDFIDDTFRLIDHSVKEYLERKYTKLMVNFGCTGGQHRSVYCAEQVRSLLEKKYRGGVEVILYHREQELKKLGI